MNKCSLLTSAALAVSILAAPAFALTVNSDGSTSNETSATTASESSNSGNLGTGSNMAGASVTSTNMAFDNSFASIVGATDKTNTNGGDQGQVVGTSFSKGSGFDFGLATQTGTSTGTDSGTATAHHFHK